MTARINVEAAKDAIAHLASECEKAQRLADFAEQEGMPAIARGLGRLARLHADQAWSWVDTWRATA